jgi:flagellar basal-body rod protein FlgB
MSHITVLSRTSPKNPDKPAGKFCRSGLPINKGERPTAMNHHPVRRLLSVARKMHIGTGPSTFRSFITKIMFDRLENELRPQRAALNVRSVRQEMLASNIANADTPHYKARDIDFKSALDSALGGRIQSGSGMQRTSSAHFPANDKMGLSQTAERHLPGESGNPFAHSTLYRTEYQSAVDGNTVNMDVERAAFAENAIQMEAMMTFINHRFRSLSTAVQGQ